MSKMIDALVWDMDGTIAGLYEVPNWEPKLRSSDPSPYSEAKPLINMDELRELLQVAQSMNIRIITVSWASKDGTNEYNRAVKKAKREWLKIYCPELLEELHVVKYGTDKYSLCEGLRAVLIDDNISVREEWPFDTIDASNSLEMLEELKEVLAQAMPRKTKAKNANYGKQGYKPIPTFKNYACSRSGRIINRKTGNELTPYKDKHGRYYVNLKGKRRSLHRIIALTWCRGDLTVEDCASLEVHHINHDCTDNRASNLVWYAHPEHVNEHSNLTNYLRYILKTDIDAYLTWKQANMK